jgi:hypothetical protein
LTAPLQPTFVTLPFLGVVLLVSQDCKRQITKKQNVTRHKPNNFTSFRITSDFFLIRRLDFLIGKIKNNFLKRIILSKNDAKISFLGYKKNFKIVYQKKILVV